MKHLLSHLVSGRPMSLAQSAEAFELVMTGRATPAQAGAMLALIAARGPSVDELAGAAGVMCAKAARVAVPAGLRVIDTCGTGGATAGTFNISTAAAIVAAGAGRPRGVAVAKHGNRSFTRGSGSSQVLAELGVRIDPPGATPEAASESSPEILSRCLDEAGICFCFAPAHHPAMKFALPVREELGFRTIFNLLGPLTNPAGADRQLMGVYSPGLTATMAEVLKKLGAKRAMVVCATLPGDWVLDELSTAGPTRVSELRGGEIHSYEFDPAALGLPRADVAALRVDSPAASAALIRAVLAGQTGPARDIVTLNAAAALLVAEVADDLPAGLAMAREGIDSGKAGAALEKLIAISNAGSS